MFSDVACRHNIHFNVKVYSYKGGYLLAEIIYMLREQSCYQDDAFFWDTVCKEILKISTPTLIDFINGLYHTNYDRNKAIVDWLDKEETSALFGRNYSDVNIRINHQRTFHMEFQIQNDSIMTIRVFDYQISSARKRAEVEDDILTISIPSSRVIYLQANNRTPTRHDYRVKCEETGESIVIPVGSVRVMMMTAKELKELGLYLLIPFLQLKIRRLVYEMRKEVKNNLIYDCKTILNDSIIELKGIFGEGILTSEEYGELMAIQQKIMRHLYQSIPEIVEGVEAKMVASEVLTYGQKLRIQVTYNIFNRIDELVQSGLSYEEAVHTAEREAKLESNNVVQ